MRRFIFLLTIACAIATLVVVVWLMRSAKTGWIVGLQVRQEVGLVSPIGSRLRDIGVKDAPVIGDVRGERFRLQYAAEQHPTEFSVQLAHALDQWSAAAEAGQSHHAVEFVRPLKSRFANDPAYHASELRFAAMGPVTGCHRAEESWLDAPKGAPLRLGNSAVSPREVSAFEHAAAAGERLDRGNAFFPLERSVALFAAHRDSEGLAAIARAANCPRYEDYVSAEVEGRSRLRMLALGRETALIRILDQAVILYPHFAGIRSAVRVATAEAIKLEKAGRLAEGFAIRDSLRKIGARLRHDSRTYIGNLVGVAVVEIAMKRPGGAAPVSEIRTEGDLREIGTLRFYAYLTQSGRKSAWDHFGNDIVMGNRVREVLGTENMVWNAVMEPSDDIIRSWRPDLIALSNLFWMTMAGLVCLVIWLLIRQREGEMRPQDDAIFLLAAGFGSLFVLAFATWQQSHAMESFVAVHNALSDFGPNAKPLAISAGASSAALAAPGAAAFLALLYCLVRRKPIVTGMLQGIAVLAAPLCLASALVYATYLNRTLSLEDSVNKRLDRQMQHEGRFYANLAGKEWPR